LKKECIFGFLDLGNLDDDVDVTDDSLDKPFLFDFVDVPENDGVEDKFGPLSQSHK